MQEGLEKFLEVVETLRQKFVVAHSELLFELSLKILVCYVLVAIILELLGLESILLEKTDVVSSHVLHAG